MFSHRIHILHHSQVLRVSPKQARAVVARNKNSTKVTSMTKDDEVPCKEERTNKTQERSSTVT
jgi:hypothetical protein